MPANRAMVPAARSSYTPEEEDAEVLRGRKPISTRHQGLHLGVERKIARLFWSCIWRLLASWDVAQADAWDFSFKQSLNAPWMAALIRTVADGVARNPRKRYPRTQNPGDVRRAGELYS